MNKLLFKITPLIIPLLNISSCTSTKYIDNYVGKYQVVTAYEKQMHHYWNGDTKEISSTDLPGMFSIVDILNSGEVIMTSKDGEVSKGKINTEEETCNFKGLIIDEGYKFKKSTHDDKDALDYSYTEDKHLLEYDYVVKRYTMVKYYDPTDFNNMIGTYDITLSTYNHLWHLESGQEKTSKDTNYNKLIKGSLTIKEDKTIEITNSFKVTQSGILTQENSKLNFIFNDENPLIKSNMNFYFRNNSNLFYISGNLEEITGNYPTAYEKENYSISMNRNISTII